jgi:hypothetical protein
MSETTDDQSQEGASSVLERLRSNSLNPLVRVAASIWRACALPTTPAKKMAAFMASGHLFEDSRRRWRSGPREAIQAPHDDREELKVASKLGGLTVWVVRRA